ncbi:MAG TPA: UDP-3-O-(3-hydroxymyristoyl)glucosamine N-acyltransferase [Thermoanaerobaculia bacterium]|nr:UDP-3-O-(3-hydroxymyristoyl)glucosamine N-acyltransferase [Thermoanaerobaculia bacterium]
MKKTSPKARPAKARASRRSKRAFFTLAQVARTVGGRVLGDASLRLTGVQGLADAQPSDLSFVSDARLLREAAQSKAGALIAASQDLCAGKPAVLCANPGLALAAWLNAWFPAARPAPGIARGARVDTSAKLGKGVTVAPGATVEAGAAVGAGTVLCSGSYVGKDAVLGEDCLLHPNAAVLERCRVGSRCILHAGAVVGSDGFGYLWDGDRHRKVPQVGIVRVEDDVEIGANAAIDRATLGETVIGRGTKIDNLVQVGHNVVVGEHSLLCGQAGIGGSSRIGKRVTLAGQVGVSDHAAIGDGAIVTGQAGVVRGAAIEPGAVVSGMPAMRHRDFLRSSAWVARLPELAKRVERLESRASGNEEEGRKPWKSESPRS